MCVLCDPDSDCQCPDQSDRVHLCHLYTGEWFGCPMYVDIRYPEPSSYINFGECVGPSFSYAETCLYYFK